MQPITYNVVVQIIFAMVCLSLFLSQVVDSIREYFKYQTATTTAYKDISKIAFPRIILCHNGDFWNLSAIYEAGYEDFIDFAIGRNKIQNGWKAGEASVEKLFEKVYHKPQVKKFLGEDSYLKVNGSIHLPLVWKDKIMNYQGGKCLELNLPATNYSLNSIILKFSDLANQHIYITVTDPYRENCFSTESLSYSGADITLNSKEAKRKTFKTFKISLREIQELEEDQESLCSYYNIFQDDSYKNCTVGAIEAEYLRHFNCTPPWFTNDYNKVCQGPFSSTDIDLMENLIYQHFDTSEFQGCKQPCIRLDLTTRMIRYISPYPYNGIKIIFNPTVEITKSVKIYTGLSLFSNIGGFLGLCLGISLLDGHKIVSQVLMNILKLWNKK